MNSISARFKQKLTPKYEVVLAGIIRNIKQTSANYSLLPTFKVFWNTAIIICLCICLGLLITIGELDNYNRDHMVCKAKISGPFQKNNADPGYKVYREHLCLSLECGRDQER